MSASSATPAPTAAPRGWLSLLTGRWHRSSWVVAAVMLLFLVFCNLPGQTVTHVDINGSEWKSIDSPIEHGWPFTWAVRPGYAAYIGIGMPSFNAPNCWEFWNDATVYIWTALAADAFVVVALTLISAGTFELWRRARARVWQLHLRDILIVVLLISLAGGWYTRKQQRHARDLRLTEGDGLTSMPGMPATPNAHGIAWHSDSLGGPTWVRQLFGEKHFQFLDRVVEVGVDRDGLAWLGELTDVRVVSVVGGITSRSLSHLERVPRLEVLNLIEARHEPEYEADIGRFFPHYGDEPPADTTPRLKLPAMPRLRRLTIQDARVEGLAALPALEVLDWRGAPADQPLFEQLAANTRLRKVSLCECTVAWHQLELLGSLPNLEHLELDGTTIDDENVKNLAALTRLRELSITNCPFRGRGLKHLASISRLESLNLCQTNVNNDAMQPLASLKSVRELNLSGTRVTASEIPLLIQMKQLRVLSLSHPGFSEQERNQLTAQLPECRITWTP